MRIVYHDHILPSAKLETLNLAHKQLAEQRAAFEKEMAETRQSLADERLAFASEKQALIAAAAAEKVLAWQANATPAETVVLETSLAIAEKLLGAELTLAPTQIQIIVRDVLAKYKSDHAIVLRLHPNDAAALPELAEHITVAEDPTLQRGDVILERPDGHVDGRIASRLERIRDALLR